MRKRTLTIALALMLGNAAVFAGSLKTKIGHTTVKKAMTEIRQQSGYSFVYETGDVDVNRNSVSMPPTLTAPSHRYSQDRTSTTPSKGKA